MQKTPISEHGLIGTLFKPDSKEKLPGIILIPGSDGGTPELFAEQLAKEGFVVFALGYFGLDGLPPYLEHVSLEYFEKAFQWFKKQNIVKENSIGLIGYSRGGELALLIGSFFPELMNAIVSYVPSSVVCGGFPHPNKPAWLYKHKPISSFLAGLMNQKEDFTEAEDLRLACQSGKIPFHANTEQDPYVIVDLFSARNHQDDLLNKAAIPVEKIQCPLLIFSAEDDKIWPSAFYGELIMDRLNKMNSPIERKHICYPNVGHGIAAPYDGSIYHPVGNFWCKLGGIPEANAQASKKSWEKLLLFLKETVNLV